MTCRLFPAEARDFIKTQFIFLILGWFLEGQRLWTGKGNLRLSVPTKWANSQNSSDYALLLTQHTQKQRSATLHLCPWSAEVAHKQTTRFLALWNHRAQYPVNFQVHNFSFHMPLKLDGSAYTEVGRVTVMGYHHADTMISLGQLNAMCPYLECFFTL